MGAVVAGASFGVAAASGAVGDTVVCGGLGAEVEGISGFATSSGMVAECDQRVYDQTKPVESAWTVKDAKSLST